MYHKVKRIRRISGTGQVTIGKEIAGKLVSVDQIDKGTWIIKSGNFIHDSEKGCSVTGKIENEPTKN